jgi:nickel-dependent lactate racemase
MVNVNDVGKAVNPDAVEGQQYGRSEGGSMEREERMDIELQHHLWEGGEAIALRLPHRWRVKVLHMRGDDADALDEDDYRKSLSALGPLVKGKKEICILFDDLTRPTRAYEVLPCLLEVLPFFLDRGVRVF